MTEPNELVDDKPLLSILVEGTRDGHGGLAGLCVLAAPVVATLADRDGTKRPTRAFLVSRELAIELATELLVMLNPIADEEHDGLG